MEPTPSELAEAAEALEARIRRAMSEHAAIAPRGFDSQRDRQRLRNQIDDLFEELALIKLEAMS